MKKVAGVIINSSNQFDLDHMVEHRSIHTIPIGGKYRLIDFPLSNLVNMADDLYVGVIGSYNYRSLADHIRQGQDWNLSRKSNDLHVLQGDRSAKIGQVVRIPIQDFIDNRGFFDRMTNNIKHIVISGTNIVANINLKDILKTHKQNNADVTLLYKKDYQGKIKDKEVRLNVRDDQVTGLTYNDHAENSRNIFMDSLIINKDLFMDILREAGRRGRVDFIEMVEECLDSHRIEAYNIPGYVKLINSIDAYYECSMDMLKPEIYQELFKSPRHIYTKSKDNHPTVYGKNAKLKRAMVASGAIVKGSVENSIISRNTLISDNVKIMNSIIMQGVVVEEGAVVKDSIIAKDTIVRKDEYISNAKDNRGYSRN